MSQKGKGQKQNSPKTVSSSSSSVQPPVVNLPSAPNSPDNAARIAAQSVAMSHTSNSGVMNSSSSSQSTAGQFAVPAVPQQHGGQKKANRKDSPVIPTLGTTVGSNSFVAPMEEDLQSSMQHQHQTPAMNSPIRAGSDSAMIGMDDDQPVFTTTPTISSSSSPAMSSRFSEHMSQGPPLNAELSEILMGGFGIKLMPEPSTMQPPTSALNGIPIAVAPGVTLGGILTQQPPKQVPVPMDEKAKEEKATMEMYKDSVDWVNRHGVGKFNEMLMHEHGFLTHMCHVNVAVSLSESNTRQVANLPLTEPAVRKGYRYVLAGTNGSNDKANYLCCFDSDQMKRVPDSDPIVAYTAITPAADSGVNFVHWLTEGKAVAGIGSTGRLCIYDVKLNSPSKGFTKTGEMTNVHSQPVREISVMPDDCTKIASGGYDGKLCFTDVNAKSIIQSYSLNRVIGSVKFSSKESTTGANTLGITLDDGQFVLFDIRLKQQTPVLVTGNLLTQKTRLYTHERYGTHHVLLGYGSEVQNIESRDLRSPGFVQRAVRDPYAKGIGGLAYNEKRQAFVASGYQDFTVWYHEKTSHETKVWSHSTMPMKKSYSSSLTYAATWLDDEIVCATSSEGYIGLWRQGLSNWEGLKKREGQAEGDLSAAQQQPTRVAVRTSTRSSSSSSSSS